MTLYEINEQIAALVDENGEITDFEALDALTVAREEKIENIGCFIKNLTADVEAIKAEKANLEARIKIKENKIAQLKDYLAYTLAGQPFETAKVKISWRKSQSTVISDKAALLEWAKDHKDMAEAFISYPEPEAKISLTELKNAINNGTEIPFVEIVEKNGAQIK